MVKRASILVLLLGLLTASIVTLVARRTLATAESLYLEVNKLEVGVSTSAQVRNLAERYGGQAVDKICGEESCRYAFEIDNNALYHVGLSPRTAYRVHLATEGGRLVFLASTLTTDNQGLFSRVQQFLLGSTPTERYSASILRSLGEQPQVSLQFLTPDKPWRAIAHLPPRAKPDYVLNLGCLCRIGGCGDARELLPVAWEDPENQWQIRGSAPPAK